MLKTLVYLFLIPFLFFASGSNAKRINESKIAAKPAPTAKPPKNSPPVIEKIELDKKSLDLSCPPGSRSQSSCPNDLIVNVSNKATAADDDAPVYKYSVTGWQILGQGAAVKWDLSGVSPGTYKIKDNR